MNNLKIELFDTTLRDGTQGQNVSLSIHDKLLITEKLDEFGINIIEGGWPGSNPKDKEYFEEVKNLKLTTAQICAFGSTARFPDKVVAREGFGIGFAGKFGFLEAGDGDVKG